VRVAFHPEADVELTEAVSSYTAIDPDLGRRFYLEMERLIREVGAYPRTFRQFDPPARRHFSAWFPYGLI
jgi:hypothetical protein